jgi:hypothetical protein
MSNGNDILGDLFHACSLAAYLEQARIQQGWPDTEATRRLACAYYEEALKTKNLATPTGQNQTSARPGYRSRNQAAPGPASESGRAS